MSIETIPGREAAVANRFIEVGYLADHARTCFTDAEDDRAAVITSGASLLPTD